MSWEYRVVHRREHLPGTVGAEDVYAIYEVYYHEDGRVSVAENPSPLMAESRKALNEVRMLMGVACQKPVLEWEAIVAQEVAVPPRSSHA